MGCYRVRGEWIRQGGILQGKGENGLGWVGYYRVRGEWIRLVCDITG